MAADPASWDYYYAGDKAASLQQSVLADGTSLTNIGSIVGALIASACPERSRCTAGFGRLAVGAIIGGLLMVYGARLAYGCNVGAYLCGISSLGLRGWLWGVGGPGRHLARPDAAAVPRPVPPEARRRRLLSRYPVRPVRKTPGSTAFCNLLGGNRSGMDDEKPFASAGDEGETEAVNAPFRDAPAPTGSKAQPAAWLIALGVMLVLFLGFMVAWGVGVL